MTNANRARSIGLKGTIASAVVVTVVVFGAGACGSDSRQSQGTTGEKPAEFYENYPCYRLKEIQRQLVTDYDVGLMREALSLMQPGTISASNLSYAIGFSPNWPFAHTFVRGYVDSFC